MKQHVDTVAAGVTPAATRVQGMNFTDDGDDSSDSGLESIL